AFAPSVFHLAQKSGLQIVQPLQDFVKAPARVSAQSPLHQLLEVFFLPSEPPTDALAQPARRFGYELAAGKHLFGNDLRGGAGRGSANVSDKIADGEINFVADGGHGRQGRRENRACDAFLVESPEVFQAPAPAGEQDQVERGMWSAERGIEFIQQPNRRRDLLRGALALHAAGNENDFQARIAPLNDVEHIPNGRARWRSHQSDSLRIARQRPFPFRREQALGLELSFEPLEGQLQCAYALQLDGADDELVLPARLVNSEVALDDDLLAVLQNRAILHRLAAKQHAVQLRVGVFQREVNVAGTLHAQIGDFARHPDQAELLFEQSLHLRG